MPLRGEAGSPHTRVPVLSVMAGTKGNRSLGPFLRRMFPLLRRNEYWPGAGHFLHLEAPEPVCAAAAGS